MAGKKNAQKGDDSKTAIEKLTAIAFGNVLDFARFEPSGRPHIFDWDKAKEVGAQVSVVERTVGRGRNARQIRITSIKMPNKLPALLKLLKFYGRLRIGKNDREQ